MTSGPITTQVVRFVATDECLADLSLFQAVRDVLAHDRKDKGLIAQYWGASVERATEYFWIILWQTRAHAAAFEDDPSYAAFTQQRDALSSVPVLAIYVHMSGNPRRCLEGPVTEVDFYKLQDDAAEKTQDMIRRLTYRIESLQMRGFLALSWGRSLEDVSRGAYVAGWRTIEEHMRLGTLEEHRIFVQESEPIFEQFVELYVSHVHFKLHETT